MKNEDCIHSSLDVTRVKKTKLWTMILFVAITLIIIVIVNKPKSLQFTQKNTPSFIQVKAHKDDFQRWAFSYENEINRLKKNEKIAYDHWQEAGLKIDQLNEHIVYQDKLYQALLHRFNMFTQTLRAHLSPTDQTKAINTIDHPQTQTQFDLLATSTPKAIQAINVSANSIDKTRLGWLPVGSFFTATLLNGIDAGTGTQSQSNPQPVLMRVDSEAFLPNQARYQVRACFILGSAYGSLPSQRALVRTARISCVSQDGRAVIDSELKGYVVDLDGKLGLRGKLINRQGAKLAKAMLAGFFGGLSNVVTQFKHVMTKEDQKGLSSLTPQASLQLAGFSGVDNATKELMHFYINEAKHLFPVIEINAGRHVVINISHGIALHWKPVL